MSNITMLTVLGEEKLATLGEGVVKTALTDYYHKLISVESSTWDAYKSFALAYANMSTVKNDDKTDRFPTKGRFYDFVGVNDSTGSLMLRAVGFNSVFALNEMSLEEMGFSACKVDMLSRVGEYKPSKDGKEATYDAELFAKFMEYVATRFSSKDGTVSISFEDLAKMTDASLRSLIKDWTDAGKPSKYTEKKSAETPAETPEPITRESILASALEYIENDKNKVNDFIKWLKAEMVKATK